MRITITIETDNAAFEGDELGPETARILADVARKLEATPRRLFQSEAVKLRDINGNTVGMVRIEENTA